MSAIKKVGQCVESSAGSFLFGYHFLASRFFGKDTLFKHLFVSISVFWITAANAQEFCILPVAGSEPRLSVEIDQPYRIAISPKVVPGFDGLIVNALNRPELYEFDGESLSLIESDFPHVWGFAFEYGIHIAPSGEAYGFGSDPKVIFYHSNGYSGWEPIEETRDYYRAFFDQGSGDVYWRSSRSGRLKRFATGRAQEERDFPVFNGDQTVSIRTIPEINGALALTGLQRSTPSKSSSIWFRASGGAWGRIAIDLPEGQRLIDTFQDARVQVINGLIRIFPSNSAFEPLFFRISPEGLSFVGSAPNGEWQYHPPSGTWIGWNGRLVQPTEETLLGFWDVEAEPVPPKMFTLGTNEIEPSRVPSLESPSHVRGQKIFYRPETIILAGEMPALIRSESGLATFDGTGLTERTALRYDAIGNSPYIRSLGQFHVVQSEKGVFLLGADLSLVHIDKFPVQQPWRHEVSIDYVDAWQTYVVVDRRSGAVYVSPDMREFSVVASAERITKFVGILPKPTSVLMVGENRLFAITNQCES